MIWQELSSKILKALNNVWYQGKTLTPDDETILKELFSKYPLGQTNFKVWYKQTLRQAWDKYLASK
jgi:hypothetical protein